MKKSFPQSLFGILAIIVGLFGLLCTSHHIEVQKYADAVSEHMSKLLAGDSAPAVKTAADIAEIAPSTLTRDELYAYEVARLQNLTASNYDLPDATPDDFYWRSDTCYRIHIELPYDVFVDDADNTINVLYPEQLDAGERGEIVIELYNADTEDRFVYRTNILAEDDLCLVHGDKRSDVASGGEMTCYGNWFSIYFYTSATAEHYRTHRGTIGRTGAGGDITAHFYHI